MESEHQQEVRRRQKDVLAHVPNTGDAVKPDKKSKNPRFNKGQQVFVNAYMSKKENEYFMCMGTIEECPNGKKRLFKIKIRAVADRPVGGPPCDEQATLLGRTISKKYEELHKELPPFLVPGGWIEIVKD